jgi:hypothetical protein
MNDQTKNIRRRIWKWLADKLIADDIVGNINFEAWDKNGEPLPRVQPKGEPKSNRYRYFALPKASMSR